MRCRQAPASQALWRPRRLRRLRSGSCPRQCPTAHGPLPPRRSRGREPASLPVAPPARHAHGSPGQAPARLQGHCSDRLIGQLNNHAGAIASLAFSPDGRSVAAADIRGTIVLWDVSSRQPLGVALQTHHLVNSVAYSPDGRTLAAGNGDNGTVGLWDVRRHRLIRTLHLGKQRPCQRCRIRSPQAHSRHRQRGRNRPGMEFARRQGARDAQRRHRPRL